MPDGELIVDLGELEPLYAEWDRLAGAAGLPQLSPAWVLGWWRHIAPAGAEPRVVAVHDRGELVGLAPFYVEPDRRGRVDYRLPGIELAARLAPLALPGREWQVAETIGAVLTDASPRPDVLALESCPVASHWPRALREGWPGPVRPVVRRYAIHGCPTVSLGAPSYEDWLASKSSHFRERMRRTRRKFEEAGGTCRLTTRETLSDDVATLMRLHTTRWESLGDSNLAVREEAVSAMLEEVGDQLLDDDGRYRLMVLELDGEPVSAYLALGAGGQVLGMNGGWDERFAKLSPTTTYCLYMIEDAIERGDRRVDLGLGEQPHKRRLADGNDPVVWVMVMTPGPRLPLTRARTAPTLLRYGARDGLKRALPPEQLDRIRRLVR